MTTTEHERVLRAEITAASIDARAVAALVAGASAGALVTFEGVVRDHDDGRGVTALEYTAHPGATEVIAAVCARVADAHEGVRLAAVHRTGRLRVGEAAIVCAVSSAHRAAAFAACAELVDELKALLPIWKEQRFTDGTTEWVGAL
ncbi:molybdenum cofactor biosynthesis protein MoaE [Microbacterium sp.]|uniref:molybdenum cofactor biosynthesis protein MoaE n=1 Tax=Microbacterium sp. TaxID=51671 RepID=UPI0025DE8463|nr:molybdenum cofactor biosynthesis protein MoaE [Microbacterium sp.]